MAGEFELIDLIKARCATARADVRVGIGDDGAVLRMPAGHDLVASTDTLIGGVHFPVSTEPEDIGWKALAVNLSDLAAMGATPAWAMLALTLPSADRDFVERFADGFAALAAQHHVALIGGDTTSGALAMTVSVLGFVTPGRALLRSGARAGDLVFVTGTIGDAAAGLRFPFEGLFGTSASREACDALRARLDRPVPRVAAGVVLRGAASACIDVSDGLLADLGHVAKESGVGIEVSGPSLPASPALLQAFDAPTRLALQASGGDDYELAFTLPPSREAAVLRDLAKTGCGATRIGRVVEGAGVRLLDAGGNEVALPRRGWEHFA
ncbi:MAG TPA: thiamine-phosphate kinase [Rhodanobacteraceae bacterium]|nr:thiamine-phosphate kinase [Rhodanobacteraceae bacterium]